jgi:hypothetical protein
MKHDLGTMLSRRGSSHPRLIILTLSALLATFFITFSSGVANAAVLPTISAEIVPANGGAEITGHGYTPNGEVHLWVYRDHQSVSYAVVTASSSGTLLWTGTMSGNTTCHDSVDVQAYDVGSDQRSPNPSAHLNCAPNPTAALSAQHFGNQQVWLSVTGKGFSALGMVQIYVYRDHQIAAQFPTQAYINGTIGLGKELSGGASCNQELDIVAYDYSSHQFSNNPSAGNWCARG